MDTIPFTDFQKLEIRIGTIITAERIPDADKLLKLSVDVGDEEPRQILAGIAEFIDPHKLIGTQCPFVVNLEPKKLRGLESHGMLLATGGEQTFTLLHPASAVQAGTIVR